MRRTNSQSKTPAGERPCTGRTTEHTRAPSVWLVAAVLAGTISAEYYGGHRAPFIFDDAVAIQSNSSIRTLWPLISSKERPGPLNPPRDLPVSGRPLPNLTFAINYHFGGLNPIGYHHVNFSLHFFSALLVWAIVRRTLLLPYFEGRFDISAGWLAMIVALLWALHPLQTEAVVYVTQRTELMMAFFYLATFYCCLRFWSPKPYRSQVANVGVSERSIITPRGLWLVLAVLACSAGMASKEAMVSAPLMVLLFERCFLAGSLKDSFRRSWTLYLGLTATWLVLILVNLGSPRGDSAGFSVGVGAYSWWLTQARVLLVYLKLAFWPSPLLLHYVYPYFESLSEAWIYVLPAFMLVATVCVLLWLNKPLGFLGAFFFAILSPTLVVPVVTEIAAERRMYLSLLAIVILLVVSGFGWMQRLHDRLGIAVYATWGAAALALILAITFVFAGANRLVAYSDELALWQGVLKHQPDNYMAHYNVGHLLIEKNKFAEAIKELQVSLSLKPDSYIAYNSLGKALDHSGRYPEATEAFHKALQLDPEYTDAHLNLANSLQSMGRMAEAREQLEYALQLSPNSAEVQNNMGVLMGNLNQVSQAIDRFRLAIRLDPHYALAHINLGRMLADTQNTSEAIHEMEQAIQLEPKRADLEYELGILLGKNRQIEAAAEHFEAALTIDPNFAQAYFNLAASLAILDRSNDAIAAYERSIEVARRNGQKDLVSMGEESLMHYRKQLTQSGLKPK